MKRLPVKAALLLLMLLAAWGGTALAQGDGPYHFGFKKSKNGAPASIDEEGFKEVLTKNGALFRMEGEAKTLYLTFDNGYENGHTVKILDTLKAKNVPAVFFVTGHYIEDQPELLKRMVQEGHLIGNHSWSHPDMTQISDERMATELDKVKQQIAAITGQTEMSYVRPPRGIFNDRVLDVSRKLGYTNVFWSIAYVDWEPKNQKGARYAYDKVVSQLHPGAIILLHSVSKDNADAMGDIIDQARAQGYEFKRLDQT
ncbi:delta-lactam-biosynthetic de-N-acetylase [Paenibacillus ginsengarvi]|uniref:Delta-lactam-biosynthetic de-N-acetylase n=1 Tax=Paenibacillus ginsengarvi TaxID=400777 RepID=A0A3B0CB99_9BACL|nr:delta-lactam-biosynthetic de-N-acetylase [Paenibacillus ginsengarvi]RKN82041.1 delta-lactam-biosynthetic de-N-acetylase [Paenibacillus ginsengarvi]